MTYGSWESISSLYCVSDVGSSLFSRHSSFEFVLWALKYCPNFAGSSTLSFIHSFLPKELKMRCLDGSDQRPTQVTQWSTSYFWLSASIFYSYYYCICVRPILQGTQGSLNGIYHPLVASQQPRQLGRERMTGPKSPSMLHGWGVGGIGTQVSPFLSSILANSSQWLPIPLTTYLLVAHFAHNWH